MNYLSYLQSIFTAYTVIEETDLNYDGDTVIVLKYLGGGQQYQDSTIQPIQIIAYTNNVKTMYDYLSSFSSTYSNTQFTQDLEYVRQSFSTPVVLNKLQGIGDNWNSEILLNGTLVISTNLSDIKTVKIDGYEYFTTQRDLVYNTLQDSQPNDDDYIAQTDIKGSLLQFTVSMENKNNNICKKARRIRQGTLDSNTDFTIVLTFTDNDVTETYTMKLHSFTLSSNNAGSPIITMSFIE